VTGVQTCALPIYQIYKKIYIYIYIGRVKLSSVTLAIVLFLIVI